MNAGSSDFQSCKSSLSHIENEGTALFKHGNKDSKNTKHITVFSFDEDDELEENINETQNSLQPPSRMFEKNDYPALSSTSDCYYSGEKSSYSYYKSSTSNSLVSNYYSVLSNSISFKAPQTEESISDQSIFASVWSQHLTHSENWSECSSFLPLSKKFSHVLETKLDRKPLSLQDQGLATAQPSDSIRKPLLPNEKHLPGQKNAVSDLTQGASALLVLLLAIGTVLSSVIGAISLKRGGDSMRKYPSIVVILISFGFIPVFAVAVILRRLFCIKSEPSYRLEIQNPKQSGYSLILKFMVIGAMNAVNGVCVVYSNPHLQGTVQTVLSKMNVPFTLLASFLLLSNKVDSNHITGALLVVVGCAISGPSENGKTAWFWAFLFVGGQIPAALSSVFQQKNFVNEKVDVFEFITWSSVSQFVAAVFLCLIQHSINGNTSFLSHLIEGISCVKGITPPGLKAGTCDSAQRDILLQFGSMVVATYCQTYLVKLSSASFTAVTMTLITPVTAYCFSLGIFMGAGNQEKFGFSGFLTGFLVLLGVIVYRRGDLGQSPANLETRCGAIVSEYTADAKD